jgi:hypothetical protein
VRYATWDLSRVYLYDRNTGAMICRLYPQDKTANADGRRRALDPRPVPGTVEKRPGMAPLMRALLADYAATGLPFAYLPKDEEEDEPGGAEVAR